MEGEGGKGIILRTLSMDISFSVATSFEGMGFKVSGDGHVEGIGSGEASAGGELICFLVL